jgi:hypothetical protein
LIAFDWNKFNLGLTENNNEKFTWSNKAWLINNCEDRNKLINDFGKNKPIGGEMEAQGIYSAVDAMV